VRRRFDKSVIAALCAASLASGVASAQSRRIDQAKQQVAAADIDYRLARFTEALGEYTKAYELYPVPALLFNIGQCHRNLKDYAKAIFFFEGYLRDAPAAPNRKLVEDLIRESQAGLAEINKAPPVTTPIPAEPPAGPPPSPRAPVEPAAVEQPHIAVPPQEPPVQPSIVVPSLLVAGGIAAVAGGAVFYYYGQKRGPEDMFIYDDTRWLGGTMVVLGGAAIATGTLLWVRHRPASHAVAAIAPSGGFLGWAGQF